MISSATLPGMMRMIRNTTEATPTSVGTIRSSRFRRYVRMFRSRADAARPPAQPGHSVLGQPHVLELLVGVVIRGRDVVLHLGPVDHVARPPEAGEVVGVVQHELLDIGHQPLAL